MPLETVASAEYKLPVDVSYCCGKCGKSYTVSQYVVVTTSMSASKIGANNAEKILRENLPSDWKQQVEGIAGQWEKGFLLPCATVNLKHPAIKLRCPSCHLDQVPYAGGKMQNLRGRGLKLYMVLVYLLIIGWAVGMGVVLEKKPMVPMHLLYVTLGCIAIGVLLGLWKNAIVKRAFRDPAYMEKRFGSVVSDSVYADFTPYGLEKIRVNSKKK